MEFNKVIQVIVTIKNRHGTPEQLVRGTEPCPVCGGIINYTISSHNGHTSGKCQSDNCIIWIE